MTTEIMKDSSKLRPRARIIKTIGDELISNDVVAIIELVKNSYDADASSVKIVFKGHLNKGEGRIVIADNGTGMDLETIKKAWMEPATNFKILKRKSGKDRKILGEKGIGRFASAKLADKLVLVTKVKDDNEVKAIFNWADFSNNEKYLDEIDCSWEVREPKTISKNGTILKLIGLESDWNYDKLRELRIALSRLINPVSPISGFKITLDLPDDKAFDDLRGEIDPPETISKPDYFIKGIMADDGVVKAEYFSRKGNKKDIITEVVKVKVSKNNAKKNEEFRIPTCKAFEFEFRVWNREPESLKQLAEELSSEKKIVDLRKDLDEAAGISIYRDGFRVLPYGEPKNDWLRLDARRVNVMSRNLSNSQVIGYVSVSLDRNIELKDQSNREGIIDSTAFTDLKDSIIIILSFLEQRRFKERQQAIQKVEQEESLFSKFDISPVKHIAAKNVPNDKELKQSIEEADRKIQEGVREVQEVISRYHRLATLGQLVDIIIHDGNSLLYGIDTASKKLEKELKKETLSEKNLQNVLNNIRNENKALSLLFKRLEPFGGRRRGRPKEFVIEKAIEEIFNLHSSHLKELNIMYELPKGETIVKLDTAELEMIIFNMLNNSIYWLSTVDNKSRKIKVSINKHDEKLILLFSDNGPGVKEEDAPYIFNPYYSTKPNGTGLGLTHVGELVTGYDGSLELVEPDELEGANFRIIFKKRV